MKPLRPAFCIIGVAFISWNSVLNGQTFQFYTTATINGPVLCYEGTVYGSVTYHLTYHVDRKTQTVDRLHANVHKAELYRTGSDGDAPEKLLYIDTGNDNIGVSWEFWENPDNNGWLYEPEPDLPLGGISSKGISIWATFHVIAKGGETYKMHSLSSYILNPDGELEVIYYKENVDCPAY